MTLISRSLVPRGLILVGIVCSIMAPLLKLVTLRFVPLSRGTPLSRVRPLLVVRLTVVGLSSTRSGIPLQPVVSPLHSRCLRVVRPLTRYSLLLCLVRTHASNILFIQCSGLGRLVAGLKPTRLGLVSIALRLVVLGVLGLALVLGVSLGLLPGVLRVGPYVVTRLRGERSPALLNLGLILSRALSVVVWNGLGVPAALSPGSRRAMNGLSTLLPRVSFP